MNKKAKNTNRTDKAINKLNKIKGYISYHYENTDCWKEIQEEFQFIEDYFIEISAEKQEDRSRMVKKFSGIFYKENQELKKENKERKKEIEDLKEDG